VKHIRIEVRLDPAVVKVEGTVHHTLAALTEGVERVRFHASELAIDAVRGGKGRDLAFRHEGPVVEVDLPRRLAIGDEVTISIDYHGTPRRGLWFVGPDAGYPDKPHEVWTQGQDEDSRYWFPCFDHPIEKATTEVLARVPSEHRAIGNGALVGRTTATAPRPGTGSRRSRTPRTS
jgi:aminopeptidase N